ncbi:MAG: hypothetical protein J2P28_05745 [Actinobacteria bacterium]|nr:hypothetical protein [Actinomycetota bacterium]
MSQHPSYRSRLKREAAPVAAPEVSSEPAAVYTPASRYAGRSCCCPAPPVVIVMIPAASGRQVDTDLLLCGHHYRAYREALAAKGATILDMHGYPFAGEDWPG